MNFRYFYMDTPLNDVNVFQLFTVLLTLPNKQCSTYYLWHICLSGSMNIAA